MAFDRTKKNCALCYPGRCRCDAKTYGLEKEANRFAKKSGAVLPLDTTGRLLGGNHERNDRGDPQDHLARAVQGRHETMELRHYLEILTLRLQAMRNAEQVTVTERPTLELHVQVLGMHLEGKSLVEISNALGRQSHSYACDLLKGIRESAGAMRSDRGSVATPCKCGRPGCFVVSASTTGRPREYASARCKTWHKMRLFRARRRLDHSSDHQQGAGSLDHALDHSTGISQSAPLDHSSDHGEQRAALDHGLDHERESTSDAAIGSDDTRAGAA